MTDNVTLTDATLDEIEARSKERRWSDTLMSDPMKSVVVNDIPALIAALRASRERERELVDLIRSVGDKFDIYAMLTSDVTIPPNVGHARLELSEAIDAALGEEVSHA